MSDKTTPSGKALEYFIKMCDSMALDPNAACNPELKTIRTALLRSQAIESGSEAHAFASRKADPDDYMRGYRDCLESLKGIGHDDR